MALLGYVIGDLYDDGDLHKSKYVYTNEPALREAMIEYLTGYLSEDEPELLETALEELAKCTDASCFDLWEYSDNQYALSAVYGDTKDDKDLFSL